MLCSKGHRYTPTTKHGRCPVCARDKERHADPHRRILSSSPWHKARGAARTRDGNRCRLEGADCHGQLQVHHIVSVRNGGAPYDLMNLITVCRHHHEQLERETRKQRAARFFDKARFAPRQFRARNSDMSELRG
jgi:5-methylcytosine-specific restriction endonuclease McrA